MSLDNEDLKMQHYALLFFVVAIISAFFGWAIDGPINGLGQILFIVFLLGSAVTYLMSLEGRLK